MNKTKNETTFTCTLDGLKCPHPDITCRDCSRPSRQQPIERKPERAFDVSVGEPLAENLNNNRIVAEIADLPDAEFKANCEKLKKLTRGKMSKKLDELIKPGLAVGKDELTDSQIMYNHGVTYGFINGCCAQAKADREAVDDMESSEVIDPATNGIVFVVRKLKVKVALKAAEIKEA